MSLRIRRGTDAQRTSIVFDQGELVWTSDTGHLYVGNGATAGGVSIASQIAGTGLSFNPITGKLETGSTISPIVQESITVLSNDGTGLIPSLVGINFNNTSKGGIFNLSRGRGTSVYPALLQNNDSIYEIFFIGKGNDSISEGPAAKLAAVVDGTVSNGVTPGKLILSTADSAGIMNSRVIIGSNGLLVAYFGISTGLSQSLANSGTVSLSKTASYFITTGSSTASLADGLEGQLKTLIATDITAGDMVITVNTAGWKSSGSGTITFNQRGASCILQFVNSAWYAVGNNDAVFA